MSRINFSIDLDEDGMLPEIVRKAIESEAKRISREKFNEIMEPEIERVVKGRVTKLHNEDWRSDEYIRGIIDKHILRSFGCALPGKEELISKIDKAIDIRIRSIILNVDDNYMKDAIEAAIRNRISDNIILSTISAILKEKE